MRRPAPATVRWLILALLLVFWELMPQTGLIPELFLPAPGGPKEVLQIFEENYSISRGPDGIYMRPPDRPGWGWQIEVVG